jgi:DNA-binding NtrC family response regulator
MIPGELISSRIKDAVAPAGGGGLLASARTPLQLQGKLNDAVESLEREMIAQGLARTRYNKSKLSRELGISRSNLILKIAKYALDRPGQGGDDDKDEAEAVT